MLIAANWKLYKTQAETRAFCAAFQPPDGVDVVVCPPFTSLAAAVEGSLTVFAQNVHWADEGAFTGEISVPMLKEVGVVGSLVGHSERRQLFGETDEGSARRAEHALASGLRVIACVGETEQEREAGETEAVLARQITPLPRHPDLVIAYEPVWAIGTGKFATPEIAADAHRTIRGQVREKFGKEAADAIRILYGGSVKPDNTKALMAQPEIDGVLVGGASLDPVSFASIVNF